MNAIGVVVCRKFRVKLHKERVPGRARYLEVPCSGGTCDFGSQKRAVRSAAGFHTEMSKKQYVEALAAVEVFLQGIAVGVEKRQVEPLLGVRRWHKNAGVSLHVLPYRPGVVSALPT